MNIFYLHNDPVTCAKWHTDKHVVKMILESAQLLSTAHHELDKEAIVAPIYKSTHKNHPSAIWVRKSVYNYNWLARLLMALCKEYTYRYGKVHKCEREGMVAWLYLNSPKNIPYDVPFTEPTPAMPDNVKIPGDSVSSYRNYYINNKQHLASWLGKINSRNVPEWFKEN